MYSFSIFTLAPKCLHMDCFNYKGPSSYMLYGYMDSLTGKHVRHENRASARPSPRLRPAADAAKSSKLRGLEGFGVYGLPRP